jgi:Cu(I)/Ag(I) efflux system membrane protein CusA/SilA
VNAVIESALGGAKITTTVEGRQRFSVSARFGQDFRDNMEALKRLQVETNGFGPIPLHAVADIKITEGPPMINSENALLRGTVLFNVRERDMGSTVAEAQQKLSDAIGKMPKAYFIEWSGQYESLLRSERTLKWILPVVLIIIFISMYFAFHSTREALLSLLTIPFALIGGAYMIYFWDVNLSVAVAVGFIALFGLAVETNIVMVIYLNDAMQQLIAKKGNSKETITNSDLREFTILGAAKRLRPKIMTVSVSLFALIPILWSSGVGSDVMKPIVLPMIGGVVTSAIYILLVTPLIFLMSKEFELKKHGKIEAVGTNH